MDYDLPAADPPPGYTRNMADPDIQDYHAGLWIGAVGIVLSTLFLVLRIYTKLFLTKVFGVDDWSLILAWAFAMVVQAITIHLRTERIIGVHIWDLTYRQVNYVNLMTAICAIMYVPTMAFAKLSLLLVYRRLSVLRWMHISVWTLTAIIGGYSIATVIALIFACNPLDKNWDMTITEGSCIDKSAIYLFTAAINALTDILILIMPIPMITKLHMPRVQKIGLLCMFVVGCLTCVTSLVRLALLPGMMQNLDVTWALSPPSLWINIEASLVIICGSLPVLRKFFKQVTPSWMGDMSSKKTGSKSGNLNTVGTRKNGNTGSELKSMKRQGWGEIDEGVDGGGTSASLYAGSEAELQPSKTGIVATRTTEVAYDSAGPDELTGPSSWATNETRHKWGNKSNAFS